MIFPAQTIRDAGDKMKRGAAGHPRGIGRRGSRGLRRDGKLLEAQRIKMRTEYDLEMMEEMGFCSGIENYSRHIAGARRVRGPTRCSIFSRRIICW